MVKSYNDLKKYKSEYSSAYGGGYGGGGYSGVIQRQRQIGGGPIHDGHYSPLLSSSSAPTRAQKVTTKINLEMEVDTLDDLIHLGKKVGTEFKLEPHIEYNIDLAMIKSLIPEMEDLNRMIGQEEFKRQVVTLILYYSMRLNRKNDDLLHTAIYGEPGIGKTEFAQKLANIYLKLGVLKNNIFRKV